MTVVIFALREPQLGDKQLIMAYNLIRPVKMASAKHAQ